MGQDLAKQVQPRNSVHSNSPVVQAPQPKDLYSKKGPLNRFSESEVQNMVNVYHKLAALSPRDKYIDRNTFLHYFPLDGVLAGRLFAAFDKDKNGHIDCDEFLGGLALCLRGSTEERGQIIFDMVNLAKYDGVSISEISAMLKSLLSAAARIVHARNSQSQGATDSVNMSEVDSVVENFVKDALSQCDQSTNGKLTKAEFVSWMRKHPLILDSVFKHTSIQDKEFSKYDRLRESHRSPTIVTSTKQGTRRTELLSQTWVDGLQQESQTDQTANEPAFSGSYGDADYLWSPVFPASLGMPCARSRHSVCVWGGEVFVYGGRGTRGTLKDFWRYEIATNTWSEVVVEGDFKPPSLQEHTAVPYKGNMYVFGGEFTATNETPLWTFNFRSRVWRKQAAKSWGPGTRRSHTAVHHEGSMFVFGGYIDMRGATNELWQYELDTSKWVRLKWKGEGPSPRYSHSAAVGAAGMWVYGGLEGLQTKNDLWRWSFVSHSWSRIKSRGGPPGLFGHSAIKVGDGMLIFGGETADGVLQNSMWRLDLGNRTWTTVRPRGRISPPVRSCFSMGVVTSSAFLISVRPSTSHSAPPCTPMPSGFLKEESLDSRLTTHGDSTGESWREPVTRWERSAASLDSLDSTAPSSNSTVKSRDAKRNQNRPASMFGTQVYENSRGMTLSDDSLNGNEPDNSTHAGNRAQNLPSWGDFRATKGRVQSHEFLNVDSTIIPTDLRKSLTRPFACLLVLGGKTRVQADMARTLDIWRCDIDPVKKKPTERHMEKITVANSQTVEPHVPLRVPYRNLELSADITADSDDLDNVSVGSDLVLADMSDSDTRSVDFLLDDYDFQTSSRNFPKVSV
ncbi:unnamed protein product [Porites evermanni]|uniref:EF-hand domain-containing protein n=1 Tax=Porites evermanni TaxID=104178 RepID=A0ABN8MIG8_9CNID|nr:unnamed protein product [Porites evermanni]